MLKAAGRFRKVKMKAEMCQLKGGRLIGSLQRSTVSRACQTTIPTGGRSGGSAPHGQTRLCLQSAGLGVPAQRGKRHSAAAPRG